MSYFDISDADGVDFGDWVEEHEEERREADSLEASASDNFCSQCGEDECVRAGHCTACGSYEGWANDDTEVTDPDLTLFDAADGGEETDDMQDPDKLMEGGPLSLEQQQKIVNDWIDAAPVRELKRITNRCADVVAERRVALEKESKELEALEKPLRATRSDKGTTRKPANEVLRDEKGVAV